MPKLEIYTVAQAARRLGMARSTIYEMVRTGKLKPKARKPIMIFDGAMIDRRRAVTLAQFEDIADTSDRSVPPLGEDEAQRADRAEQWIRDIAAARDLFNSGIKSVQAGEQVLIDALLGGLPTPR